MNPKILVVEDDRDCREILAIQLHCLGYGVIEADSGPKGLEKAVSEIPDLIIMDIGLPGIDGIEATRWLKEDRRTKHIPIVVHTAFGEESRHKRALEAGAAKVLLKPVSPKIFQDTIQEFLQTDSPSLAFG